MLDSNYFEFCYQVSFSLGVEGVLSGEVLSWSLLWDIPQDINLKVNFKELFLVNF